MAVRRIIEDFEARLSASQGSARGKAEWERYGDGGIQFDVWVRGIDLPDSTTVEVLSDDTAMGSFQLQRGRGRLSIENPDFRPQPGETVSVVAGMVLVSGYLEAD